MSDIAEASSAGRAADTHAGDRVGRWAAWGIVAVLALALLVPLARFVDTSARWLPYPYPRAGSEGLILYESLLVKHGGDIYSPITPERFISGPYPPVFYWLAAAVLPSSLPNFSSPAAVTSIFEPGRIISLAAAIVAALCIVAMVVADGQHLRTGKQVLYLAVAAGIVAGGLFLTLPQVMVWATRFRGDMLMLALTAGGLASVAVGRGQWAVGSEPSGRLGRRSVAMLLLGAVLFAVAFYTKQTALAGPIAAAAYLLLRDWRTGLKWCMAMAVAVLVPFVLLEWATGHWFYLKMVDYHSLPLRSLTLTRLLQFAFWEDEWPLILLAAGYLLFALYRWVRGRKVGKALGLVPLFVAASFATLPTGAVVGADHNHLLMSGLAIAAAAGAALACLLAWLVAGGLRSPLGAGALALSGAAVLVYVLFTSAPSSWYSSDLTVPPADQQEQLRKIVQNVRQNPGGLFFADDPGIVALAGKETPYDDPFTMTALAQQKRWDESVFRQELRDGKFSLLVLSCDVIEAPAACRADIFTPGVMDSIRAGYRVLFKDVLFTYAPVGGH